MRPDNYPNLNCPFCDTNVNEHEANRCFDAWVAIDVMGLDVRLIEDQWPDTNPPDWVIFENDEPTHPSPDLWDMYVYCPKFTTLIQDAWLVWMQLSNKVGGYDVDWRIQRLGKDQVSIYGILTAYALQDGGVHEYGFGAMPKAICQAALKAAIV